SCQRRVGDRTTSIADAHNDFSPAPVEFALRIRASEVERGFELQIRLKHGDLEQRSAPLFCGRFECRGTVCRKEQIHISPPLIRDRERRTKERLLAAAVSADLANNIGTALRTLFDESVDEEYGQCHQDGESADDDKFDAHGSGMD